MKAAASRSGDRREEIYETPWGSGRLVTVGDLPLELDLPDMSRSAGKAPQVEPGTGQMVGPEAGQRVVSVAGQRVRTASPPASLWRRLLERYFAGQHVTFKMDAAAFAAARRCTRFSAAVYAALATVPYGEVVSYRDLAVLAGHPNAYRAVGSAMARNPLPVILPCHRVIKSDGVCGKYGADSSWKPRLLALEGRSVDASGKVRTSGKVCTSGEVRASDEARASGEVRP